MVDLNAQKAALAAKEVGLVSKALAWLTANPGKSLLVAAVAVVAVVVFLKGLI